MVAVKRDKWVPTGTSVVCRRHFTDMDYITGTVCGRGKWPKTGPLGQKLPFSVDDTSA